MDRRIAGLVRQARSAHRECVRRRPRSPRACVTTSPSAENVRGACFSSAGLPTPSISISEGGVSGSWILASRSPLLSDSSRSRRQTSTTPIVGNPRQGVRGSTVCRRRADLEHRAQFVEDRQHEFAGGPEEALQGAPWPRLEDDGEIAVAGQKGGKRDAEHGVRRKGLAAGRPRGAQLDDEPVVMGFHPDVGRQIEFRLSRPASSPSQIFWLKKSIRSMNQTRGAGPVSSNVAYAPMRSAGTSKITGALIDRLAAAPSA